jgi:hypothetical protein
MHHLMTGAKLAVAALGLLLAAPSGAVAQGEGGVHVDPNSPAGKEYALPLDSARREAAGGQKGAGTGTSPGQGAPAARGGTPLFGAGIRPARSRKARSGGAQAARDRTKGGPSKRSRQAAGPQAAAISGGASGGTGTTIGVALAVLALGCGLGFALRRALRSS